MTGDATAAPPILRFTLRLLDAPGLCELAEVCAEDMVGMFGCRRATVRDEERVWAWAEGHKADGSSVSMAFRLSGPLEPKVFLEVTLDPGPDVPVIRQQIIDLMAIARRAWRDRRLLCEERQRARQDALTGLDNRRGIGEYLEHAIGVGRHTTEVLTVMLVDLDNFKNVNDTHGHHAGDDVLQLAATCFREVLRPSDRLCRWGGDEFLIACPGLTAKAAIGVAERLRTAFREQPRSRGTTMSIGIADTGSLSPGDYNAAALIRMADANLYAAKRAGRDRHCPGAANASRAAG